MGDKNKDKKYGTYKSSVGLINGFNIIYGMPDNTCLDDRFISTLGLGAFVGFNYGMFGTVIRPNYPKGSPTGVLGRIGLYAIRSGQGAMQGGVMGALYAMAVTGSCKLRGDKDDYFNHFVGGFGLSAPYLIKGSVSGFITYGVFAGIVAAVMKSLYMDDFEFKKRSSVHMTNCRYPELYVKYADLPREKLNE